MQGVIDGKYSSVSRITLLCYTECLVRILVWCFSNFPHWVVDHRTNYNINTKNKKIISKSYYWCEKLISDGHTVAESSHDLTHTTYLYTFRALIDSITVNQINNWNPQLIVKRPQVKGEAGNLLKGQGTRVVFSSHEFWLVKSTSTWYMTASTFELTTTLNGDEPHNNTV